MYIYRKTLSFSCKKKKELREMKKKDFIEATKYLLDDAEIEVFIHASQILRRKPFKVRVGHEPLKPNYIVIEVYKSARHEKKY